MTADLETLMRTLMTASPQLRQQAMAVLMGQAVAMDPCAAAKPVERYLSRAEVAEVFGVSPWTVWRWSPPSHDIGGNPRYLQSEVQAYLASEDFKRRQAALRAERRHSNSKCRSRRNTHADLTSDEEGAGLSASSSFPASVSAMGC